MDVLKFTLKGPFAFFKKPDVNTYYYFTYGNIHKVALLGIFGAVLGYEGYNQCFNSYNNKKYDYPKFYDNLKEIEVAIVPKRINPSRKVQTYNNSVGYASQEQGGNLIIKEQWLENPQWDIYLKLDSEESNKVANAILTRGFVYLPYLGKNDHFADIEDVRIIKDVYRCDDVSRIDCLYVKKDFQMDSYDDEDDLEAEQTTFKYEEKLPIGLEKETNKYEVDSFIFTNNKVKKISNVDVYDVDGKNIVFY